MKSKALILIFLLGSNCRLPVEKDDELTLERVQNKTDKLKLSGYYMHRDKVGTITIYFLYDNGILASPGSFDSTRWIQEKSRSLIGESMKKARHIKFLWGVYQIRDDTIVLEQWHPTNGPYHVYRERGKIISDTSFVLTESKRPYGREPLSGREPLRFKQTFTFRKYLPKPDSTNEFIE